MKAPSFCRFYINRSKLLFCCICVAAQISSRAQLATFTLNAPAQAINICGPAAQFSISMNPGGAASTGNVISVTLPTGISYVAGSAVTDNGATIGSVTGTSAAPVFNIPNLAASSATTLTFNVVSNCNYTGGLRFTASATGSVGATPLAQSVPINVNSAVFVISSMTNQNFNGAVLTTYNRVITIQNTGTGLIDTLLVKDTVGMGRVVNSISGNNGVTVTLVSKTPVNSGNDTAWLWKVYGFTGIGNLDLSLNSGESFSLTQSLTIVKCTNLSDRFWAELNCVGLSTCNRGFITGGAVVPASSQPSLTIVTPTNSVPIYPCIDDATPLSSSVLIRNTSAGAAYNVRVVIGGSTQATNLFTTYGNGWIDTTTLQMKTNNGSFVPVNSDSTVRTGVGSFIPHPDDDTSIIVGAAPACAGGKAWLVRITIPVLAAGDSVRISYDFYHCNPAPAGCTGASAYLNGLATQLTYSAQCSSTDIKSPYTVLHVYQSIQDLIVKANGLSAIYPGSNNTIAYNNSVQLSASQFSTSSNGSYAFRVRVPYFLSMPTNIANVDLSKGSSIVHPVSITQVSASATDTVYDITFNINQASSISYINGANLYLRNVKGVQCPAVSSGVVIAPLNVQFMIRATQNACSPYEFAGCFDDTLSYICPNPCARGGISGTRFTMMRTNYGQPDATNSGSPNGATLDSARIRMDLLVYGDTLAAIASGKVLLGTQANFTNGYFEPVTSKFSFADGSLNAIDASISIYNSAGVLRATCNNLPLTKTAKNQWSADFSISAISLCLPGYTQFADGDSLVARIRYYDNYGSSSLPAISGQITNNFYLSNIVNPAVPADRYACDTGYASLTLIPTYFTHTLTASSTSGCDSITLTGNTYLSIGPCCANYTNLQFPYEFRAFAIPNLIRVALPAGTQYAGRARITGMNPSYTSLSIELNSMATVYTDSVVFNIRDLFADRGGPLRVPDEGWQLIYEVKLFPKCASGQQNITYNTKSYNEGLSSVPFFSNTSTVSTNAILNAPVVSITTSPQTQTVTGNVAVWELQVSNAAANAVANNAWMAEGNGGTTTIQTIQRLSGPGGSVVATIAPVNGIYQLGNLGTGSNAYFRATVSYANCVKDTLNLIYGYSCFGYPASVAAAPCSYSAQQLYIISQSTQLQLQVVSQPVIQQTLCVDTSYTLQMTSVQPGTVYNPVFNAVLPANGFVITPGSSQIEYPAGVFTTIPDPVLVNGSYTWNTSSVSSLASGLPSAGVIKLKFSAQATGCNFNSGDYLSFTGAGITGCGALVTSSTVTSNQYILVGDPLNSVNNFTLTQQFSSQTVLACPGETFTYTYVAVNVGVGPSNASTEVLAIEAPSWLTLNAGSFVNVHNGPISSTMVTATSSSTTTYTWDMPGGVAVGDSVKFTVQFSMGNTVPALAGCGVNNYAMRDMVLNTFTTSAAACAGGGVCTSKTIRGLDTATITTIKYGLKAAYIDLASGTGNINNATIKITNTGSIPFPSGNSILYAIYSDINDDQVLDAGDIQISPTITATGPLAANAADSISNVIGIDLDAVDPAAIGKKVLLVVKDSSCNCISVKAATPESIALPVDLLTFTANSTSTPCENIVFWTTANEYDLKEFIVERSTDGTTYQTIGRVMPATDNNNEHAYSLHDGDVNSGVTYFYRLRMVDNDGSYKLSKVVRTAVSCGKAIDYVMVYPNPTNTGTAVTVQLNDLPNGSYNIRLLDPQGRMLKMQTLKVNNTQIIKQNLELTGIAPGVYLVNVLSDEGKAYHAKVIVR